MKKKIMAAIFVLAVVFASAMNASAALTTFTDRASWLSAVGGVTTIDFNSLTDSQYQSLTIGPVTFDVPGRPDGSALWVSGNGSYPGIEVALVGNHGQTTVRATFSSSTVAVGSDVNNLSSVDTIGVSVVANNITHQYGVPVTGSLPYSFFGVITDTGTISEISFAPTTSWVGIDNFSYASSASVPLPPSALLLLPGLVGLAGFKKRFRK